MKNKCKKGFEKRNGKCLKKKLKKFKAKVYGENMFGKPFHRTIIVKGVNARKAYNSLKSDNAVNDIESFIEID